MKKRRQICRNKFTRALARSEECEAGLRSAPSGMYFCIHEHYDELFRSKAPKITRLYPVAEQLQTINNKFAYYS